MPKLYMPQSYMNKRYSYCSSTGVTLKDENGCFDENGQKQPIIWQKQPNDSETSWNNQTTNCNFDICVHLSGHS